MRKVWVVGTALAIFLSSVATAAALESDEESQPISFRTNVKIFLDSSGKPNKVMASEKLPQQARAFVEEHVASWRFSPAIVDGVAQEGVTYATLGGCAVPHEGGYRFAIDYKGNGPGIKGDTAFLPPPRYPLDAAKRGMSASMVVTYLVETDGTALLEEIEYEDGDLKKRKHFDAAISGWVKTFQYFPEELGGKQVRTRISAPVSFSVGPTMSKRAADRHVANKLEEMTQKRNASPECAAAEAKQPASQSVAVDSPFKRLSPGG